MSEVTRRGARECDKFGAGLKLGKDGPTQDRVDAVAKAEAAQCDT